MKKSFVRFLSLAFFMASVIVFDSCSSEDCADLSSIGVPQITDLEEGDNVVKVVFESFGGSRFTVEAIPNEVQALAYDLEKVYATGATSPITVEGLEQGVTYRFRIKAGTECEEGQTYSNESAAALCADKPAMSAVNRAALLDEVNAVRNAGYNCHSGMKASTNPVKWNTKIEEACLIHSVDMDQNDFFAHRSNTDGSDPGDRLERVGYNFSTYGENIALGYAESDVIGEGWLKSTTGHCDNIMNPNVEEMAIARSGRYFTQVFGTQSN